MLVHGFGSSLYTWKDVIPGLAADHDVVALDLPGFGLSDQPADLTVDDLPRAVIGLMDRLGMRSAALVGNSMGGAAVALRRRASTPSGSARSCWSTRPGFNLGPAERPRVRARRDVAAGALLARLPGKSAAGRAGAARRVPRPPPA